MNEFHTRWLYVIVLIINKRLYYIYTIYNQQLRGCYLCIDYLCHTHIQNSKFLFTNFKSVL